MKMLARSLYPQVSERDFGASFLPVLTALYLAGEAPLLSRELVGRLFEIARVGDRLASAERILCSRAQL